MKQSASTNAVLKRGLNREEAASYVGISVRKFEELVADGRMPQPKKIDARRVWDIRQLDAAFDALPGTSDTDGWGEPSV
jgi:predicted DNA-binding transcriptional regulator AlpA